MAAGERHQGSSGDNASMAEINALRDDIALIRAAYVALSDAYDATLAKLDLDAGVTDVDYASTNPAPADPAAATVVGMTRTGGVPGSLVVGRGAEPAQNPL